MNKIKFFKEDLQNNLLMVRAYIYALIHKKKLCNIEKLCLFIGYPRSGHSLIGALLNAHPDLVISHELDILKYMKEGYSRDQLLYLCMERDRWFNKTKKGQWGKYNYILQNGWQGRFRRLRVIGDKKGGRTTEHLINDPLLLSNLHSILKLPIYLIHVVRHPLDNIASISHHRKVNVQNAIDRYFNKVKFINEFLPSIKKNRIFTIHLEDFVLSPYQSISQLLSFLDLEDELEVYQGLSNLVAPSPLQSRQLVNWSTPLIESVDQQSRQFDFLKKYDIFLQG
jgi:hypothetical protein